MEGTVASLLARTTPDRAKGWGHCVLGQDTVLPQYLFSTQVYKWVLANLMLGGVTLRWTNLVLWLFPLPSLAPGDGKKREPGNEAGNGPASHAGESRNTPSHKRDKLRSDGPLGSYADLL